MKPIFALLPLLLFAFPLTAQTTRRAQQLEKDIPVRRDTALVNTLNSLCWEYRRTDTEKALHYGERAAQLSRSLRYWKGRAYASKNLGTVYSISGDYANARLHLDRALQQFSELHNRMETGNVHNLYGLLYWETGKYDNSLASYDRALKDYTAIGDREGITIVHSNVGIIYYETGKLDKAMQHYRKALLIARSRKDYRTLASIHTNIGLVYSQLGDFPKSLYHQKRSVVYETDQENYSGLAKSYTNIGVTYYKMGEKDSSLAWHVKALKLYELVGEKKGISQSLVNIGAIYNDRNDFGRANAYYERALPMKRAMSDVLGEAIVLTHLGRLRMQEGKPQEAVALLENGYRCAYKVGSLLYAVETSLLLAELYEQLGNDAKAMDYYKVYTEANTRFLGEKSSKRLTDQLIALATEGKQQEIRKFAKKAQTANGQKTLIAITASLLVALTGLCVVFIRKKHRREKLQLEADLAVNKAALMAYTHDLIQKNAGLAALQEHEALPADNASPAGKTEEQLEALNRLSEARIVTDEDWEAFKKLYARVYPHFMLRMKERYPGITQAELRLAALMTLQLSSREIAAMLGISSESVKKARQRLRRKMELDASEELETVLSGVM